MNNSVALIIGLSIIGLVLFDWRVNDAEYIIFWSRNLLRVIEWIAFWR